jgi:hypothetical protein
VSQQVNFSIERDEFHFIEFRQFCDDAGRQLDYGRIECLKIIFDFDASPSE